MSFSIVLFDDYEQRGHLLPLVATRPIANLRIGALTLDEKWRLLSQQDVSYLTVAYLQAKFPLNPIHSTIVVVNGGILPTADLYLHVENLPLYSYLVDTDEKWIAVKINQDDLSAFCSFEYQKYARVCYDDQVERVAYPEDIFTQNNQQILADIKLLSLEKTDVEKWSDSTFLGVDFYIDDSVKINQAILDARSGPIFLDKNVVVESGAVIKGPTFIGCGSRLKLGTMMYPNVTIGPNCTVSGEINNTVIWGNSAKGHEGYLGCAVIGQGCNLGAGTTNSNLKNDWSSVKLYDYLLGSLRDTGLLKCGVVIGDQVMLGIQSKINTGTVIGVGSQVATSKFIPKFVPDFSWYTEDKEEKYIFARFMHMLKRKAAVKKEVLDLNDEAVYQSIYETTLTK